MTLLRKGDTVSNTQEIKVGGGITLAPGTHFYCTRGGKASKLCFVSPLDGKVLQITDHNGAITALMTPIDADKLPAELKAFFELDAPTMPPLKKGMIMALGQPKSVITDKKTKATVTAPTGTRIKVMRGGKSPQVMALLPGDNQFSLMGLTTKEASLLVATSPVPDNSSLSRILVKVKTYPAMSEETVACQGTVTLDGRRLEVRNGGGGTPLECHNIDAGVARDLAQLLVEVLADAGVTKEPFDDLIEDYLDFTLNDTFGMETFADFMRAQQASLAAISARFDK